MQALVIILALDVFCLIEAYGIEWNCINELHHVFQLCFSYI